jgi:hypothetical protein
MVGQRLLRLALSALPGLLLVSSLAALLMSIPAWGAGNHAGLSAWMPTAAGIVIGLPGAIIAASCLRGVLQGTRGTFSVTPLILSFGLLTMPVAIATETAVAVGVADVDTYDRLLETTPGSSPLPGPNGPGANGPISPDGFMAGTVMIAIFLNGIVGVSSFTYVSAVNFVSNRRFADTVPEYDAVAELLMGHRGPRAPLP